MWKVLLFCSFANLRVFGKNIKKRTWATNFFFLSRTFYKKEWQITHYFKKLLMRTCVCYRMQVIVSKSRHSDVSWLIQRTLKINSFFLLIGLRENEERSALRNGHDFVDRRFRSHSPFLVNLVFRGLKLAIVFICNQDGRTELITDFSKKTRKMSFLLALVWTSWYCY